MTARRTFRCGAVAIALLFTSLLLAPAAARAETFSTGPSAFCHVTDGTFTDCLPGGGSEEWSDISFLAGVGTSAGAIVYTDQSVAPPRLLLMYDLTGHTVPLAPDSFFDITFHVVEDAELEVYTVLCFGDSTFKVFEDGKDITEEATTVDCAVGFNGVNVQVELEIDTLVTYSPDIPLFWSTHAPPRGGDCPPEDPRCQPCPPEQPGCAPRLHDGPSVETSSSIVIASSDGTTQVVGLPVGGVLIPAQLCDRATGAGFLVDLLGLLPGGNHGQFVSRVSHGAKSALDSLAGFGLIPAREKGAVHGCVVSTLARKK